MIEDRDYIQLRFFRDLYDNERLIILNELANISEGMLGCVNLGVQRIIFEFVDNNGKLDKLAQMMEKIISERSSVE